MIEVNPFLISGKVLTKSISLPEHPMVERLLHVKGQPLPCPRHPQHCRWPSREVRSKVLQEDGQHLNPGLRGWPWSSLPHCFPSWCVSSPGSCRGCLCIVSAGFLPFSFQLGLTNREPWRAKNRRELGLWYLQVPFHWVALAIEISAHIMGLLHSGPPLGSWNLPSGPGWVLGLTVITQEVCTIPEGFPTSFSDPSKWSLYYIYHN